MCTIVCPISVQCALTPHALALITDEKSYTYFELDALINGTCALLRSASINPSEPLSFTAEQNLESIVALFALFREGIIALPLSARLPSERRPPPFSNQRAPSLPPLLDPNKTALHIRTSGSSGTPKCARLSLNNFIANAEGALPSLNLKRGDRYLLSIPLYHVGGLSILFRSFLVGATCVLSTLSLKSAIERYDITHASLVPAQLYSLLNSPFESLSSLKCLLVGGAPLSERLWEEAMERALPIRTSWGMTETASLITCDGRLLPGREVMIDTDGQVLVRGPVLFQGYVEAPLQPNAWFATGDMGRWEGSLLIITGRRDNRFFSGGENIQPEEIELALCTIPGIDEAIVIPQDDPKWGSRPIAFIKQNRKTPFSLDEIHSLLASHLEKFKLPIAIHPLPEKQGLKWERRSLLTSIKTDFS